MCIGYGRLVTRTPTTHLLDHTSFTTHSLTVEVNGLEYSFAGGAGVFCSTPKQAPGAIYRETVVMGRVADGSTAIARAIEILRAEFGPDDYHILNRNCNAFADRLCQELVGKGIPGYCNRLASFGSVFSCILPRELTQEAPVTQDPSAGVGGGPSVGRYVGNGGGGSAGSSSTKAFSGEGMRMGGGNGGAAAETKETEAERRERVRQATLARMGSSSSS